ncbi:LTA synthase family protein [Clostridium sp. SYSU_GA19001]|uniref:LTA synthase family protein n=1 Tax=Clostridium caldaquaticum TaxID=2940653 RepID=UPI0020778905|nr:LTA synthase family protein [Clostridium caldaquaticum]MCM8710886.1 LTA synthase family protein [Clostridium caldaquaticum]
MKKLKNIIVNIIDIILFFVTVVIKTITYGRQIQENYFSIHSLIYPVIASVIIICSLLFLVKRNKRPRILIILNLILSIVFICDLNYYRYFKDIPSLSVLRNGILLGSVKSSIGSLFKLSDLLFLCDLIIFIFIKEFLRYRNIKENNLKIRIISFAATFLFGCFLNSIYIYNLSVTQPRLISTMFNRVYIAKELGIINAHGIDIYNIVKNELSRHTSITEEKEIIIKSFMENNSNALNSNLTGESKGKNLIMIQVEALQQFVIDKTINGKEITPNLNRWIKRSAYFNNFFYQTSAGGTSDAEFMSNNSLYPAPSGAAYYLYSSNEYNALPELLRNNGYDTAALHGFKSTFWNRDVIYKSLGFNNFFNEKDYIINEKIGLGLSDKSFFEQSLEKIKSLQKPFYTFLITLSSHFPFEDRIGYGDFPLGDYENTLIGDYIRAVHYTDEALGNFLENLEKEGLLQESIVVIYGDHSAISKDKQDELAKFMGIEDMNEIKWAMLQKVPMIIHFPEDKHKGVYETFGGQIDIYPTLSNLFSLDSYDVLGKDLFNSKNGTVIFRDGSFTDGSVYYSAPSNSYFDIKTNTKLVENEYLKLKKENAAMQLEYSDDILKHNLLKKYNKIKE